MKFNSTSFYMSLFFISSSLFALEVDKKLKARILDLSSSKKTVLINKGSEDGLRLKDQGKFSDTSGVFARGEVIKITPGRSAWSLFRIYAKDVLVKEKAVLIKIAAPFKVTIDQSRSLGQFSKVGKEESLNKPIIRYFKKVESTHITSDGIDYTPLDEVNSVTRDQDIDWKQVDGYFDADIRSDEDYSALK